MCERQPHINISLPPFHVILKKFPDIVSISFVKGLVCVSEIQGVFALAGVAQWIERQPANQRVASSNPSQGTCLGCRPGPQFGVHEKQPRIDVSLPLFHPPFPSS